MACSREDYERMVEAVRRRTDFSPRIGIVLGSGLGGFADELDVKARIPYGDIPGLPRATNASMAGQYVLGTYDSLPLILMQGRLHYYEGYTTEEVVRPIRLMKKLGIDTLILTNAAGGISYGPGTLMLFKDHLSFLVPSPLIGPNDEELGPRFPDMSDPYDSKDRALILKKAREASLPVEEGVYMNFTGPQYESRAEIRAARTLGADACGMSTVSEAIAANHMGLRTLAVSLITNWCTGLGQGKLSDAEVVEAGKKNARNFTSLLKIMLDVLKGGKNE